MNIILLKLMSTFRETICYHQKKKNYSNNKRMYRKDTRELNRKDTRILNNTDPKDFIREYYKCRKNSNYKYESYNTEQLKQEYWVYYDDNKTIKPAVITNINIVNSDSGTTKKKVKIRIYHNRKENIDGEFVVRELTLAGEDYKKMIKQRLPSWFRLITNDDLQNLVTEHNAKIDNATPSSSFQKKNTNDGKTILKEDSLSSISSNSDNSDSQTIDHIHQNLNAALQKNLEPVKKDYYLNFPEIHVLIEDDVNKPVLSFTPVLSFVGVQVDQMEPLCSAIKKDLTNGVSDKELVKTLKDAVGIQFKFYFEPQFVIQQDISTEPQKQKQKQKQIKVDMDTDIPDGASGIINVKKSKECTFITKAMNSLTVRLEQQQQQQQSKSQQQQQQQKILLQQINPYDYKNLQGIQIIVFKGLRTAISTKSKQSSTGTNSSSQMNSQHLSSSLQNKDNNSVRRHSTPF